MGVRHGGAPHQVTAHHVAAGSSVWSSVTGAAAALAVVGGGGFLGLSALDTFYQAPQPAHSASAAPTAEYPPQSTSSVQAVEERSRIEPVAAPRTARTAGGQRLQARSHARLDASTSQQGAAQSGGRSASRPGPATTAASGLSLPAPPASAGGSSAAVPPPSVSEQPPGEAAVFQLATLNVLGHSHTTGHGNKPGYASGTVRLPRAVQVLTGKGVDLVGFQELEAPQYHAFERVTGGSWGVFPALSMGTNPVRNSIAWRKDTWTAVSSGTIPVPYFHGNRVPMPWVVLRHTATGQQLAVINIHNPVSSARRGDNERWRDLGTAMEIGLVNRLRSTTPVVLMGDFNERDEAFCTVTTRAPMHAANGGSSAPCHPPAGAGIDWIFGTSQVAFSAYERYSSPLLRSATDHPLVVATARLSG